MEAKGVPSVEDNFARWDESDWAEAGEEWSHDWGGSLAAWRGSLFPRLGGYLPVARALEIAPGFGRWTQYLKGHCDRLTLVDLTPKCIEACRRRFSADSNIEYAVNDGKTLPMIAAGSVDFAFSFDSLVHAEADAMESYVRELRRVLSANGVAFIHHSNCGRYRWFFGLTRKLPRGQNFLRRHRIIKDDGWRGLSMTAERFREFCDRHGLHLNSQEIITWGHSWLMDCISVVTQPGSKQARPTQILENRDFFHEVPYVGRWSKLYLPPAKSAE
jgi:ubiquinone/menaquinone biosynthesis C-methylase UbiE